MCNIQQDSHLTAQCSAGEATEEATVLIFLDKQNKKQSYLMSKRSTWRCLDAISCHRSYRTISAPRQSTLLFQLFSIDTHHVEPVDNQPAIETHGSNTGLEPPPRCDCRWCFCFFFPTWEGIFILFVSAVLWPFSHFDPRLQSTSRRCTLWIPTLHHVHLTNNVTYRRL